MKTIRFTELSIWLKFAIIAAWISGLSYVLAFFVGFFGALQMVSKTITCAECNTNYTYDEKPGYPRKYCANCSAKKQNAWEQSGEPKETVVIPAMPIPQVSDADKERLIVRQCCLKAAVEVAHDLDDVIAAAERFEKWVFR